MGEELRGKGLKSYHEAPQRRDPVNVSMGASQRAKKPQASFHSSGDGGCKIEWRGREEGDRNSFPLQPCLPNTHHYFGSQENQKKTTQLSSARGRGGGGGEGLKCSYKHRRFHSTLFGFLLQAFRLLSLPFLTIQARHPIAAGEIRGKIFSTLHCTGHWAY